MSTNEAGNTALPSERPFFLSILCSVVFVYSGFFILLFATGILFNAWITRVLNDYLPERNITSGTVLLICIAFAVLYGLSFFSAFLLWRLKKLGLFLYVGSCLCLAVFPIIGGFGNYIPAIVFTLISIALILYYRRLK